ncbi:DUF4129 domain-containing protein [Promicromonospora thailandica]|uniref:Protein-glutamine gamma-glutamyltransferase-like C-terminal domain-containing protein n=1 Tax=Promicromonospora thailandica TaxID=765201 RepID=A0A9X2G5W8_9MICO|nr:DUF4129 domain-containing protein [Promicromonospora thailandica]MCP2266143.1 protein of unknown function (DUF4129) [Promicromonospora thailandica]BFF20615.1 DUF4129 domain-containing protein [Promicromonospora thailandica]
MRADLPVVPDRDTAREWLAGELSKPEYAERESLLARAINWVLERLSEIDWPVTALAGPQLGIVVVIVVAAVLGIAWLVAGPVRLGRERAGSAEVLGSEDTRTAAQLRTAADAAAARGDWRTAVVERFRAVVRSLEDRVVIEPRPGRTAQEAAADAGRRLPAQAEALHTGADVFDGVEYGDRTATADDDAALRALDDAVTAARPEVPA